MEPWWTRPGLEARDGRLLVAGRDAEAIAREHGTPVDRLRPPADRGAGAGPVEAFERAGAPFRLRLALKAQREPEVLAFVRGLGSVGIDACSPGEVRHALEHGWSVDEISFTGTNLSAADVDALVEAGVHVNLDLRSQLERWGRRAPGTTVGIRVNPRAGASWSGMAAAEGESLYAKATADEVRHPARAARRRPRHRRRPRPRDRHRARPRRRRVPHRRARRGSGSRSNASAEIDAARARRGPRGRARSTRAAVSASRNGPRTSRSTSTRTRACSPSTWVRSA